jgi:glycosyltransferase involved in cell wall biosynthesis
MNKKMKNKVCLFGTYNYHYSRNSSIRNGLRKVGTNVTEVHFEIPMERMELAKDFSLQKSLSRIWKKLKTWVYFLSKHKEVCSSDVVVVLHPGHLDLPIAWLLCLFYKKTLVFDTGLSPYDTMIVGRNMADKKSLKAKLLKFSEGSLLRLPDKLFTDTRLMKQFIVSEFGIDEKKIFVVPLGANNTIYQPKKRKSANKKTKVLFFGMYNPLHGARYILQATRLLRKEKGLQFILIGDGPLKRELVDYAKKYKLGNITFKGFIPEKKLVEHIQAADILLGTFSNSRIMQRVIPNKVFGTLACRKPLITARQPVLQEFFKNKTHIYYCKPKNSESLAQAIKLLSKDKKLRSKLAKNGYRVYKEKFTPRQIGKALLTGLES